MICSNLSCILLLVVLSMLANDTLAYQASKGEMRLQSLRDLASVNRLITFNTHEQFVQYALTYPRPYDLVLYLSANNCVLCDDLLPDFDYLADLYYQQGAMTDRKNPVFFVRIVFSGKTNQIFQYFKFTTAPNIVVSKQYMSIVSQLQRQRYLQNFKWAISSIEGHVTTHKMLQFVNKRTSRDIIYKPTLRTMLLTFFGFISVAMLGVVVYQKLQFVWLNWVVWFVGSIMIYVTCVSGIFYDIIHGVPFIGRNAQGQSVIFSGGNRQQYGAQGLVISIMISLIGVLFIIAIFTARWKLQNRAYNTAIAICMLLTIYWLVRELEGFYRAKSWYGPRLAPPDHYQTGSVMKVQGNVI